MFAQPRVLRLLLQSVLFESQLKVILKYYAQPMLTAGLARHGIDLVATRASSGTAGDGVMQRSGALWIGLFEWIRESLGGVAARSSRRFERSQGSADRVLDVCYGTAAVLGLIAAGCFALWNDWLVVAAIDFVLLTALQNVRRPVFVSALNAEMEKSMRATILSLESVAKSIVLAVMLPLVGVLADRYGPGSALLLPPCVLLAAWPLSSQRGSRVATDVP